MKRIWWVALGLAGLAAGGVGALAVYSARQLTRRRIPDTPATPADHDLRGEPVAFPSRDGLTLRGWFIPANAPRGTVIFCHGHAGSMDPDLRYAPAFNQRGYNVLAFDFRAHGRSEGDRVSMGALERLDLLGAVDWLGRQGIDRVGVLGFSMGGRVAIRTAPETEAIVAVVSDGGPVTLLEAVSAGARDRGLPDFLSEPVTRLALWLAGRMTGCDLSEADAARWVGRLSPRALMLIHGGQDPFVSTTAVRELFAAAGDPKDLWIVPEAGHRRIDRLHPWEYREKVIDFFDRHLAGDQKE